MSRVGWPIHEDVDRTLTCIAWVKRNIAKERTTPETTIPFTRRFGHFCHTAYSEVLAIPTISILLIQQHFFHLSPRRLFSPNEFRIHFPLFRLKMKPTWTSGFRALIKRVIHSSTLTKLVHVWTILRLNYHWKVLYVTIANLTFSVTQWKNVSNIAFVHSSVRNEASANKATMKHFILCAPS